MKIIYVPNHKLLIILIALLLVSVSSKTQSLNTIQSSCKCNYKKQSDSSHQNIIKARILWDGMPVKTARLLIGSRHDGFSYCRSDSIGNFTIDVQDTLKNICIYLCKTEYDIGGYYFKLNDSAYFKAQAEPVSSCVRLIPSYYRNQGIPEFYVPYQSFANIEESVKDKFQFRDVKQIATRYKGIYSRF